MKRAVHSLASAVLCFAAAGCATLQQNVQRPTASLTGMNLGEVTGEGFVMNFLVDVSNPNAVDLPVKAADYQLGLAGVKVLSDGTKLEKGLAANSSTSVTMPVMVRFEDLLKAEREIVKTGGDVPFALSGNLDFGNAGGWLPGQGIKVPVSYSGTLPLKQLINNPQALLQSPAAKRLAQQLVTSWLTR
jgi:LEA14-like dessication related protein